MKPERNKKYMLWIREQACCICDAAAPCEPHHYNERGKGGKGTKCSDYRCLPFCFYCHHDVHNKGRDTFLQMHNLNDDIIEEMILEYNRRAT